MYIIFKCLQAGLADIFAVVGSNFSKPCGCCGELYFSIFLSLAAVVVSCVHL